MADSRCTVSLWWWDWNASEPFLDSNALPDNSDNPGSDNVIKPKSVWEYACIDCNIRGIDHDFFYLSVVRIIHPK